MFSLIIAIVSIALIVALVALGGYFGGDAVSDAQAKTQAARLISEERQILASMDMFQADNKRWPSNLEELLTTGYLRSLPQGAKMAPQVADTRFGLELITSAHADTVTASALGWSMPAASLPIIYTVQVPKATCQAYNLASRGDNGILRQAFEVLPAQCYGVDGDYRVVVKKVGTNINLTGVLDSSVEQGALPAKEMDDWWDSTPEGAVQVPTDPVKTPKAELALGGAVPVAFGQVQLGQYANSGTVTITNRGKVVADGLSLLSPNGFSLVNSTCGAQLGAGATCSFALHFEPTAVQSYADMVKVTVSNGPAVQAAVTGAAVAGSADLTPSLNFGDVPADQQLSQNAILRNTGIAAITLGGATASGPGFAVASSTCASTLAAGASCTISVQLTAAGITQHSGQLTVPTAEVGALTAALVGRSISPVLSVSPASVDVGNVQTGSSLTSPVTHVVTNYGNVAAVAVTIKEPSLNFKVQANTCTGILAVGGTCSFRVLFAPFDAVAYANQSFAITGSNGGSTSVVASGTGKAQSATLSDVAFGAQASGTTQDLSSTLTNTGFGPLQVTVPTASSVANTSAGTAYSFLGTTCTSSLAVSASCTITVRHTATGTSTDTGTLKVNAGGVEKVAQLTGTSAPQVTITFTIGAGGVGASGAVGTSGGTTSVTYLTSTITAYGGTRGRLDNATNNNGGTGTGTYVAGGYGAGKAGQTSGGGGGGIGGTNGTQTGGVSADGGAGAGGADFQGLMTAVQSAGYTFGTTSLGGVRAVVADGVSASAFGSGGGGGAYGQGGGGAGMFGGGGGGGGAAGSVQTALFKYGGNGGQGAVVLRFTDSTSLVLTSGTSYTVPISKTLSKIWAVGGGGAGSGSNGAMAGGGGGAGGVSYLLVN